MTISPSTISVTGYIGINAGQKGLENVHVRRAIAHAIDLDLFLNYYPGGLASIIYRGMSSVSWAYPEGLTEAYYPYDKTETKSKIKSELDLAVADNYLTTDGDTYYYGRKTAQTDLYYIRRHSGPPRLSGALQRG